MATQVFADLGIVALWKAILLPNLLEPLGDNEMPVPALTKSDCELILTALRLAEDYYANYEAAPVEKQLDWMLKFRHCETLIAAFEHFDT
jgi:hypothetical protein